MGPGSFGALVDQADTYVSSWLGVVVLYLAAAVAVNIRSPGTPVDEGGAQNGGATLQQR